MFRVIGGIIIFSLGFSVLSIISLLQQHDETLSEHHGPQNVLRRGLLERHKWIQKLQAAPSSSNQDSTLEHDHCVGRSIQPLHSGQHLRSSLQERKPLWIASYPGSGSELFRSLIEGLTGLDTDEVYNKESHFCQDTMKHIAACKTHWPMMIGLSASRWGPAPPQRVDEFAKQAIVLLRNPAKAIPAHFNYKWEEQHHVSDHSQQGSEEDWREWRTRRFNDSIAAWKKVIMTWEKRINDSYRVAVYVPYEELVTDKGPQLLKKVADVLSQDNNMAIVPEAEIPCVWQQLVRDQPSKKRKSHSYTPSFSATQQQNMFDTVSEVAEALSHRPEVVAVLKQYLHYIQHDLRVEDQQTESKRTA